MSATNRRIIVWGTATEQASEGNSVRARMPHLRRRDNVETLRKRYSELTALAARLIDECRRLRSDNDDLRGSAEIWIQMYERQLARANGLEKSKAE
jgi:hypothetical protein